MDESLRVRVRALCVCVCGVSGVCVVLVVCVVCDMHKFTCFMSMCSGTDKVRQALRCKHLHVVNPDWLWGCLERWEKVEEQLYPIKEDYSKAPRYGGEGRDRLAEGGTGEERGREKSKREGGVPGADRQVQTDRRRQTGADRQV